MILFQILICSLEVLNYMSLIKIKLFFLISLVAFVVCVLKILTSSKSLCLTLAFFLL